jgi:hypothetical protein
VGQNRRVDEMVVADDALEHAERGTTPFLGVNTDCNADARRSRGEALLRIR